MIYPASGYSGSLHRQNNYVFKSKIMQSQKLFSIRTSVTALSFCALLIIAGCNNVKDNDTSITKAPSMDIHTATVTGDINSIKQHIAAGTDLNSIEPLGGSTALITSIVLGKKEIAMALIEGDADLNISNNDGSTPLYCAAFFGRTDLVKVLLEKDADKTIMNNFGSTAFEAVSAPFEDVKIIYDQISKDLGPLGLKLDYEQLKKSRPVIADILR